MRLDELTLEDKVGQLFCCGWQGAATGEGRTVNAHAAALVDELRVGGVILMGRNVGPPAETAALCNALQQRSRVPLLVSTDQEGGSVSRFVAPGLTFPGNMALGAAGAASLVEQVAAAIGTQLRAMGLNVDYAPVLDVNNNPANPIIGTRSFGESPSEVARLGVAALRGFASAGVLAAVKHFPGHGDTAVDSHHDLPVQPAGRDRLDAVELFPLRAAIAAGVPMVMTTHIVFPALDAEQPATLSRRILTGLLREELGFEGLIITDCLEMKAIADRWGAEEAAVQSLEAGADLLLVCHTESVQRRMWEGVLAAVRSGRISESRLEESLGRLFAAKRVCGLFESSTVDPNRAAEVVGAREYCLLEQEAARAGVAALGDIEGVLPLRPGETVTLVGEGSLVSALLEALSERGVKARSGTGAEAADATVIVADGCESETLAGLTSGASSAGPPARRILVAFRDPYALAQRVPAQRAEAAPLRLAAFGTGPCNVRALADALTGEFLPAGRMPVTV
jgi:beta-N-acetylhexosaminidase